MRAYPARYSPDLKPKRALPRAVASSSSVRQRVQTLAAVVDESLGCRVSIAGSAEVANVIEDLVERLRCEPEDLRCFWKCFENLRNFVTRRRANLTEVLREYQIRSEVAQELFVDLVEAFTITNSLSDCAIDLALTHRLERQHCAHNHGFVFHFRREVTFVSDAHDRITEPERAGHLRR